MKSIDKLKEISEVLQSHGIESPEKEAEILLRHGTGIDALQIYRDNPYIHDLNMNATEELLKRRLLREPLSYILGYEEFLGLRLKVGPGVLIPRPETELMAEQAIKRFKAYSSRFTALDLCTGSGCLALAIARKIPSSDVYGVDISNVAIGYARENARLNSAGNASFIEGDLLDSFKRGKFFDLIVSNPPYIKTGDIRGLQPEISDWEPEAALDGGEDGLDFYRKIIPSSRDYLKDCGVLMLEIGAGSSGEIADILKNSGYSNLKVVRDYSGIERILEAEWRS